jgi:GTP:adenosylcobinamide-phosphate guanylyltransferase
MTPTFTCVIPAHNEGPRIAAVLHAARHHPLIARVIVVNDGSTDRTAQIAQDAGAEVLHLHPNRGKTAALAEGLALVDTSHVLLLDADLTGLHATDLTRLIAPVERGQADVTLSLRGNAPRLWHWLGVDYITGERVLPMALLTPCLPQLPDLPRFGLEVFLNNRIRAAGLSVAIVRWKNVASPSKSSKRGRWAGVQADIAMLRDILRTVSLFTVLRQIAFLRAAGAKRGRVTSTL